MIQQAFSIMTFKLFTNEKKKCFGIVMIRTLMKYEKFNNCKEVIVLSNLYIFFYFCHV